MHVAPSLARVIENAGAPVAVPARVTPPAELPGAYGALEGVRGFVGMLTRGVAYSVEARARYGDVYRVPFVGNPMVVVWDADEIAKIFRNEEQIWSTAMGWDALMFEKLDPRKGNIGTLLSLDFEEHRLARKLVQPGFTLKAIEGYLTVAGHAFDEAIDRWLALGKVDFKSAIRDLLAEVALAIFTGLRDPGEIARVDRALSDFWGGMMSIARNPLVSPTFRRAQRGLETLLRTFLALVPERRRAGGTDLFSRMCQAEDEDGLGDEAMVRVFVTVMFGAFDTTSAAMTSMAYLLARAPDWQGRLRDEVLAHPGPDALKKLQQTDWAWKETLRLMPVSSFMPRRALRDTSISGYAIPAGAMVGIMNGAIGRHPRWWTAPDTFDPARFSPERAEDKRHALAWSPFGAGVHACVGMQLANMEAKLFWQKMLARCSFRLTRDYDAMHVHTPMGSVSGKVALTLSKRC